MSSSESEALESVEVLEPLVAAAEARGSAETEESAEVSSALACSRDSLVSSPLFLEVREFNFS